MRPGPGLAGRSETRNVEAAPPQLMSAPPYRLPRSEETIRRHRVKGKAGVAPAGSAHNAHYMRRLRRHAACKKNAQAARRLRYPAYAKHKSFLCNPPPSVFLCGAFIPPGPPGGADPLCSKDPFARSASMRRPRAVLRGLLRTAPLYPPEGGTPCVCCRSKLLRAGGAGCAARRRVRLLLPPRLYPFTL